MEKGIDAVFYNFKYYILPDEYADLSAVEDGAEIRAKRLKEELCMAPNFVYESIEEETLTVENAKLLCPVKVNLYTHEEYDKILAEQVHRVCPGCRRYIDNDDPTLDGHHREISLDGVCYEREDGNAAPYSTRVWWFYDDLKEHLDELAKCIDKGDNKKFDKICKECARYIQAPEKFIGGVKDGKYSIYMLAGLDSSFVATLLAYTAAVGAQKNIGLSDVGWQISPYLPAGVKKYKGKIKDETKLAALVPADGYGDKYEIKLYCKDESDKKRDAAFVDFCAYMTDKVGEKLLLNGMRTVEFTDSNDDFLTAVQVVEKFSAIENGQRKTFPPGVYIGWSAKDGALPYRRSCEGLTVCSALSAIAAEANLAENFSFNGLMAYAYVFVPATEDNVSEIMQVVGGYLAGEDKVPEPLLYAEDFTPSLRQLGAFMCYSDEDIIDGIAFECLVTDEKAFFRFIKILTPVLTRYGARIVVVNDDGVQEYKPGYVIEPADCGTAN